MRIFSKSAGPLKMPTFLLQIFVPSQKLINPCFACPTSSKRPIILEQLRPPRGFAFWPPYNKIVTLAVLLREQVISLRLLLWDTVFQYDLANELRSIIEIRVTSTRALLLNFNLGATKHDPASQEDTSPIMQR